MDLERLWLFCKKYKNGNYFGIRFKPECVFVICGRWSVIGGLRDVATANWDTAEDFGKIAES